MYKLILVDDEEEVRKGILDKIDWQSYGFEIAGEAENGIEALEIAEKVSPDVVITDIKMPFMDGLTLSEKLKERFQTTNIVILTGFDEFEYAQRAIKLNVTEYILKPISANELVEVLQKVKNKIDDEIRQKKDIEMLRENYIKSLPLLKEKFLSSLITGRVSRNEIIEKSKTYGIDIYGGGFVVSTIRMDFNQAAIKLNTFDDLDSSPNTMDRELVKIAVFNTCEEIIKKHNSNIIFYNNDYIIIIFKFDSTDREKHAPRLLSILEEIRQNIEKYHNIDITIGIGTLCSDITEISSSYESAVAALDYRIVLNSNNIIWIEDIEPCPSQEVVFDEIKERSLSSCIKVGTTEEIIETIDSFFDEISEGKAAFKDYQIYLLEMLTTILKVARDLNVDMDNLFGSNYNLFVEIYKFKGINEVKEWIKGICIKIRTYISNDRQDTCKHLVKRAIEYIKDNYNNSELTIDCVCKYLHISPTYFSTIFKRETKFTFINYLTQIRMEAAKELLRTTDLKTLEIAKVIGYSEPNYFSYCFKKNYGISPSEYRKANKTA